METKKCKIIIWDKYNKLKILGEVEKDGKYRVFKVQCDCWNICIKKLVQITTWRTKSCWCLAINNLNQYKHWQTKRWNHTKIYNTYYRILNRCNNPLNSRFKDYGGRWIKCEWTSFEDFYKDMNIWCEKWLSIDRINNDWNYSKSNCKWATNKEQSRNTRSNVLYKWKCLTQWCEELNLNYNTVYMRIYRGASILESLKQ